MEINAPKLIAEASQQLDSTSTPETARTFDHYDKGDSNSCPIQVSFCTSHNHSAGSVEIAENCECPRFHAGLGKGGFRSARFPIAHVGTGAPRVHAERRSVGIKPIPPPPQAPESCSSASSINDGFSMPPTPSPQSVVIFPKPQGDRACPRYPLK